MSDRGEAAEKQLLHERVERDHGYHKPGNDTIVRLHEQVREATADAAHTLINLVPPSRELSLALTALDEARMWANMGIATNQERIG